MSLRGKKAKYSVYVIKFNVVEIICITDYIEHVWLTYGNNFYYLVL